MVVTMAVCLVLFMVAVVHFSLQFFDFTAQGLEFLHLAPEETDRDARFLLNTSGREHVQVGPLVATVLEIASLDETLVDQRFQAIIRLAQAHAQLLC